MGPAWARGGPSLPRAQVCVFGGFNTMTEADLGALYLLALCPEAAATGAVRGGGAGVAEGEAGLEVYV